MKQPGSRCLRTPGTKEIDFVYCDQLCSYKLAYWAFELAERAATALTDALPARFRGFVGDTATNFAMYRSTALAPAALAPYDAEYELSLTT